jgi:hypothetical protein
MSAQRTLRRCRLAPEKQRERVTLSREKLEPDMGRIGEDGGHGVILDGEAIIDSSILSPVAPGSPKVRKNHF